MKNDPPEICSICIKNGLIHISYAYKNGKLRELQNILFRMCILLSQSVSQCKCTLQGQQFRTVSPFLSTILFVLQTLPELTITIRTMCYWYYYKLQ